MASAADQGRQNNQSSAALTRDLLLTLPAAVAYVAGPHLVYEFANEEYRRIVGDRQLIGLPLREALPEVARERVEAVECAAASGEPIHGRESEIWIRRGGAGPEQLFVDFTYQPVPHPGGGVAGVLLYGSDVTSHVRDRRRLEELARRLASTEERYRTLFETLPQGVIHHNADGSILGANPAAAEILGLTPEAMTAWPFETARRAVREDGSAYDPAEFPVMAALRTGEIVADAVMGVPHGRTGELRWLEVTAVPDARDERGRPQRAYAMFTDVTEHRRAEATLRESNRLMGRLREANVLGVAVANEDGVVDANDAYLDIIGYSRDDMAAGHVDWRAVTPAEWAAKDADAVAQLRLTGACRPYEKEYTHRDGRRVPVLVGAAVVGRQPLRWATFVVDLRAPQRRERERAELLASEQAARTEAETARDRLAFLLRAGDLVAATGSSEDLLEQVTRLVVPALADYCVAFMPTPDGKLRATHLTHRDPAAVEALMRVRDHPIPASGPLISQAAYTTGATQLASEFSARTPAWAEAAPGLMRVLEDVRPVSALAAPLLVGRHPLGVLVLGRLKPRSLFSEADVAVVEELARRLAAGLANAETFAREHTVAETLQHALLPEGLPAVPGLDLAVRYLPATDGVHVGGDWYDAFPLDGGRVGLAVGDVAGHSIDSASTMGQVRSLLRGYAMDSPSPADVLRRVNRAMSRLLPDALATACYAVLDPSTGELAYASAGHLPALCACGPGDARYLDAPAGAMLGASPDTDFAVARLRLPPHASLLLYTDGLVEDRERDIDEGLAALAAALGRSHGHSAEQICRHVRASLLGDEPRADDVCVLAVRRRAGR